MRKRKSSISELHVQVSNALRLGKNMEALQFYETIEKRKPKEPRWSHRKAELLHRMGRDRDALVAYQRAVDLYTARGFDALAAATMKLMLQIEAGHRAAQGAADAQTRQVTAHVHAPAE